jgi:hypothetical protein
MITIAVGLRSLDLAQNFDPIDAGKNDVQQDEIGILILKDFQALLAGKRGEYLKSILPQTARDGMERKLFVIDDQSTIWHIRLTSQDFELLVNVLARSNSTRAFEALKPRSPIAPEPDVSPPAGWAA